MGGFDVNQEQPDLIPTGCQLGLTEFCPNSCDSKITKIGWRKSLLVDQCVRKKCPLYKKIFKWIYI